MTVQTQLAYLVSKLGDVESPPGSNHVDVWDAYHQLTGAPDYQGSAWCGALAVVGCYHGGWPAPANFISVAAAHAWGNAQRRYVAGLDGIEPGDLLIFRGDEHISTCERVLEPGHIQDIGGNTSAAGYNPNGGGVYRNVRSSDVVAGYLRVHDLMPSTAPAGRPAHPVATSAPGHLAVDGQLGPKTWAAMQQSLAVKPVDGVPGPITYEALQRRLSVAADGICGPVTIRALQRRVGAAADGVWGPDTTRQLQKALNAGRL